QAERHSILDQPDYQGLTERIIVTRDHDIIVLLLRDGAVPFRVHRLVEQRRALPGQLELPHEVWILRVHAIPARAQHTPALVVGGRVAPPEDAPARTEAPQLAQRLAVQI